MVDEAALLSAELGCPQHQIEQATQLLQACEPRGIAARTLKECLSLQIEQVPAPLQELVQRLINNHLEDIATGRLPQIAKQLKRPVERIQQATDALRRLHPKPGAGLFDDEVRYVIPDVTVHHIGNRYIVVSNDNATPAIRFNPSYTRLLQHTEDLDTQRFLLKSIMRLSGSFAASNSVASLYTAWRKPLYRCNTGSLRRARAAFAH